MDLLAIAIALAVFAVFSRWSRASTAYERRRAVRPDRLVLVFVYLVYALLRGERLLDDRPGLAPDRLLRGGADGAHAAARRLHGARLPGRARGADARLRSGRAPDLPGARHDARSASRTGRPTRARRSSSRAVLARAVRDPAHPGHPSLQPDRVQLRALGRHVQHDVLVRHQHQLAVLRRRDDDVVLLADGGAGGAELRLGRGRHGRAGGGDPRLRAAQRDDARQLLGRPDPDPALHPAAAVVHRRAGARLPGRRADARRARSPSRRRSAATRRWRSARPPRRSRSSSSAPTAAASSTSTRRCRSRTQPSSRTSSRCCSSC